MLSLPESSGVNVLAPFGRPSSICQSAEGVVEALRAAGIGTKCFDVPVCRYSLSAAATKTPEAEAFDISLLHVQPDLYFDLCYLKANLLPRPGVRRIGMWYFETEHLPAEWACHLARLDEFWAPTRFIADAVLRRQSGENQPGASPPSSTDRADALPVRQMLPGIRLPRFTTLSRNVLGFPRNCFVFLFLFDIRSGIDRKNPLGLIQAFSRAFRPEEPVSLVIKIVGGAEHPAELRAVREAADREQIVIIDRHTSREETLAMFAACDAYVSLHRAEGLGLTLAEAMLLGKPVIATGYSGNLDFMTPDNSFLVAWTPDVVRQYRPPFQPGQRWAAPSLAHAAQLMRFVYEHPDEVRQRGTLGQVDAQQKFLPENAGRAMADRLAEIRAEPLAENRPPPFAARPPLGWNSRVGSLGHRMHRLIRQHGVRRAGRRIWHDCQGRV